MNGDFEHYTKPHQSPSIAVNPLQNDNYIYSSNDYSEINSLTGDGQRCGAYYSRDSAQTWSAQGGGDPLPNQAGYKNGRNPTVAFDHSNNAYVACQNFNTSIGSTAIYVFQSVDQGASYGTPALVVAQTYPRWVTHPNVTTDPYNNNVYVSWSDLDGNPAYCYGPCNVMFASSVDGYATHTAVSGNGNPNTGAVLAAGTAADEVYVAWQDYGSPNSIAVKKSTDHGQTFGPSLLFASIVPFPLLACGHPSVQGSHGNCFPVNSWPTMDVCRNPSSPYFGHVYIAWADNKNGDGDIFFIKSTNGGSSWSSPVRVNDDALNNGKDQILPWMSVDPKCKINIVWYDRRLDPNNEHFHLFITDSTDDGTTFLPNVRVTTAVSGSSDYQFGGAFVGDYIGLTSTDNANGNYHHQLQRAVPAWMDTSFRGVQDIAAATVLEAGSWANLDLVLSPFGGSADNIEIFFPGDLSTQFNTFYQGGDPVWGSVQATYNSGSATTTLKFFNPNHSVPAGGTAHVGFNIPGNPGAERVVWSSGGTIIGDLPVAPVDFRYDSLQQTFAVVFCAPTTAPYPLQISRLQFAPAELPVQLEYLNPKDLQKALPNVALRDVPPPPLLAPGDCGAVQMPRTYPKYKAMILVADEKFSGDSSGNLDTFFVQAIAGAEVRRLCDVNADHQIDSNDIQAIRSKLGTRAAPMWDPADADHDGYITEKDARLCTVMCTKKNCAL